MQLDSLLPLRGVALTFEFREEARLRFFHQPALGGLLRHLLDGTDMDPRLWLEAPDSGRCRFQRGERYRLHLYSMPGMEPTLERLVDRLRRLPAAGVPLPSRGLGLNLAFRACEDLYSGETYRGVAALALYDREQLYREVDAWTDLPWVMLRFLSPVRLLRAKEKREGVSGEARFVRDRGELTGPLLGQRLHDTLAALLALTGTPPAARQPSPLHGLDDDIAWIDAGYRDQTGNVKPMGGVIGEVQLGGIVPELLPALVLGQHLGIGQRRALGWGRYRLEHPEGRGTRPPRQPSRTVLQRAAEAVNVERAYCWISDNSRARNAYAGAPEDFTPFAMEYPGDADTLLDDITGELRDQSYRPPNLQGAVLQRPGKAPRPLAIPPFADRVAQRAVVQILSEDFEALHSEASFGYRRGLSRLNARDRIQYLYRKGYRWFYEADIEDFFDSVSHTRLETRLRSLLTDDPVVDLLMAWVSAPVEYRGRIQPRPCGLPQGSPVSPMLANLLLDDFDADLQALGMELVRYADDFVIVCRDRGRAEQAARQVESSLAELGLTVNPDKTRIGHLDQGLKFLGYCFLGELAIEAQRTTRTQRHHARQSITLDDLPPRSWLARLATREPQVLRDRPATRSAPTGAAAAPPEPPDQERVYPRAAADSGCVLFLTLEDSKLSVQSGRLAVATPDGHLQQIPWPSLEAVVLFGRHRITGPTLMAALRAQVPVHFASPQGRHLGTLASGQPGAEGHGLWLAQQAHFADPQTCLGLAREIVEARLHNQAELLRQSAREEPALAAAVDALRRQARRSQAATDLNSLNGIEGAGAKAFFEALGHLVPEALGFDGRQRRPPPDPFNALLSLGYTVLYHRVDTIIRVSGLLPWCGFYHQSRGRHAVLASDLMEPFRHLVERQALALVRRRQLGPEHFLSGDGGSCRLTRPALRLYLEALTQRFVTPVAGARGTPSASPHQHILAQCRQLQQRIRGHDLPFTAYRLR